jgi:hypothetical protein
LEEEEDDEHYDRMRSSWSRINQWIF